MNFGLPRSRNTGDIRNQLAHEISRRTNAMNDVAMHFLEKAKVDEENVTLQQFLALLMLTQELAFIESLKNLRNLAEVSRIDLGSKNASLVTYKVMGTSLAEFYSERKPPVEKYFGYFLYIMGVFRSMMQSDAQKQLFAGIFSLIISDERKLLEIAKTYTPSKDTKQSFEQTVTTLRNLLAKFNNWRDSFFEAFFAHGSRADDLRSKISSYQYNEDFEATMLSLLSFDNEAGFRKIYRKLQSSDLSLPLFSLLFEFMKARLKEKKLQIPTELVDEAFKIISHPSQPQLLTHADLLSLSLKMNKDNEGYTVLDTSSSSYSEFGLRFKIRGDAYIFSISHTNGLDFKLIYRSQRNHLVASDWSFFEDPSSQAELFAFVASGVTNLILEVLSKQPKSSLTTYTHAVPNSDLSRRGVRVRPARERGPTRQVRIEQVSSVRFEYTPPTHEEIWVVQRAIPGNPQEVLNYVEQILRSFNPNETSKKFEAHIGTPPNLWKLKLSNKRFGGLRIIFEGEKNEKGLVVLKLWAIGTHTGRIYEKFDLRDSAGAEYKS